jgi:uncharacterized protein (DUF2252 family)
MTTAKKTPPTPADPAPAEPTSARKTSPRKVPAKAAAAPPRPSSATLGRRLVAGATEALNQARARGYRIRKVSHPTVEQRIARGKAARNEVPRSSHSGFVPVAGRPDPIELLERQGATRVPELVPIRYGRMASSPFAFFRGAAYVMASDLATTPSSGLHTQVCGDAHLSNFGIFASPERSLVFDLNDFDETLPGPWEWDVKRLAASLEVAGRQNQFTAAECRAIVLAGMASYREAMAGFAAMTNLDVWYAHLAVEDALARVREQFDPGRVKLVEKEFAKAKTRDHLQAFSKLVTTVDGRPQFVSSPPLLVPVDELIADVDPDQLQHAIRLLLRSYRNTLPSDRRHLLESFDYVQLARKVVGVGSVGTRCWVVLLLGRDSEDPLLLQVKEAPPSVLEEFVGASRYRNSGQRVVEGQRLMQAASDIFLGWQHTRGIDDVSRDFYVRQLRDWKGSVEIEQMRPQGVRVYAQMCGWTLARAHARSGDRIAISGYLGKGDVFDRAVADFASDYADQNERDHAELLAAITSGRVKAVSGL